MQFNVSGLIQEGIGAVRKHDVEGTITSEGRPPERVAGSVELLRTKNGVLVRAHLELVEPEVCSRCLKPLEEQVSIDFEEEFQATVDPRSGEEVADVDPDAFRIDSNHMLDLTEAVRQYREVSLVMQPLCRPDCRGLCPRCGTDLNQGVCRCEDVADVRWEGLAALRGLLGEGEK
jgi:uncharacterized protein